METKICKKCGQELPLTEFENSKNKDGHLNVCKKCRSAQKRLNIQLNKEHSEDVKICPVCGQELNISEFKLDSRMVDGRYWMCRSCYKHHDSINKGKDKNYFKKLRIQLCPEYRNHINELKNKNRIKNLESSILQQCKKRAMSKGLEFNLTLEDIVIPEKCPILEVPFVQGTKENYMYTPSIDRIDNSKGYVKGNIQIISMKANTMKNSASFEELQKFCKNILRYSPNNIKNEDIEIQDKELV